MRKRNCGEPFVQIVGRRKRKLRSWNTKMRTYVNQLLCTCYKKRVKYLATAFFVSERISRRICSQLQISLSLFTFNPGWNWWIVSLPSIWQRESTSGKNNWVFISYWYKDGAGCTTAKCRNNAKCHNQRKMSQNIACLTQNVAITAKCHKPNAKCHNAKCRKNLHFFCKMSQLQIER